MNRPTASTAGEPAGPAAPPPRPRTSGWVKLGTGLAVIAAEITESVLHPAAAEVLGIAELAILLIAGLIVYTTIVRGSPETVERVFRLLRWIANRPEPAAPDPPAKQHPTDLLRPFVAADRRPGHWDGEENAAEVRRRGRRPRRPGPG